MWAKRQERMDALLAPISDAALRACAVESRRPRARCRLRLRRDDAASRGTRRNATGVDISKPMLARARERAAANGAAATFVLGDAAEVRFDTPYDLLFSRFGVMFFADPTRGVHEPAWRAARGRRVCVSSVGSRRNSIRGSQRRSAAARPLLPPQPPLDPRAPGPFAFADPDYVREILTSAGFSDVRIDPLYDDARAGRRPRLGAGNGLRGRPLEPLVGGSRSATRVAHRRGRARTAAGQSDRGRRRARRRVLDRSSVRLSRTQTAMSWDEEIEELRRREALALQMGGADKVARQHEFGKLTIRERIAAISDPGSFHEIGTLAGVGRLRRERRTARVHAVELRARHRRNRRPPGHSLRRRLHRARRLGRCVDRRQAATRRRSRARTAPAARPSRRRHGRRRFGEDDRDRGPHVHSAGARLGNRRRTPVGRAVGVARAGIGRRHRRRARRRRRTTR